MKRKSCGILALAAISTILLPITTVNGAKSSSSKIRGGGNTIATTLHHNNNGSGKKKKRTRHDTKDKRLPIQDSNQKEKILKWNLLQQQLLEVENIDELGRVQDDISESPLDHNTHPEQQHEEDEQRRLSTSIHHKKTSDYGFVSVEHAKQPPQPASAPSSSLNDMIANSMNGDKSPDDPPQAAPSPAVVLNGGSSHAMLPYGSAATHTKIEPSEESTSTNNNNSDSSSNNMSYWENYIAPMTSQTSTNNNNDSSNNMSSYSSSGVTHSKSEPVEALYYPIFIRDPTNNEITSGTCTNLDTPPKVYHNPSRFSKFMFNTKEECCISWYINPYTCLTSQSTLDSHNQLLKRHPTTGKLNRYYPIFDINTYPNGACVNNGLEPKEYVNTDTVQYLFIEEKYCCGTWFMDVTECLSATEGIGGGGNPKEEGSMEQQSHSVGDGELISDADLLKLEESMLGMASYGHTTLDSSTSNNLYYPSLNTNLYPNGACLHDGNQPSAYNNNNGGMKYLFTSEKECCDTWFMEGKLCLMASVTNNDDSNEGGWLDTTPSPTPDETYISPWPTWSDDDDTPPKEDTPQTLDFVPADASDSFQPNTNYKHTSQSPKLVFYESFESGDFTKYDWSRPTFPTDMYDANSGYIEIDKWEADRTGIAYHGNYAARPGIISTPNGQSNLTISLEDLDTSMKGGLLSYSIHASVEIPIDVIYFSINDRLLHVYNKVTGSSGSGSDQYSNGEWETASVLLQKGEHVLTWSYQYYGMPTPNDSNYDPSYVMDPRRVGNTWLDAITFELFTGDVIYSDNGDDTKSLLYNDDDESEDIRTIWSLASDTNAYLGTHSYIAHTTDITMNTGSSEISWTIIAGPSGGILSFAIFANVYAPHDLLEFSVDGIPEVLFTTISSGWEQKYIQVEGGKHVVKWKLIKNVAGLSINVLDDVNVPDDYEGYVKVDGIMFLDNQVHYDNAASDTTVEETITEATQPIITTTEKPEIVTTTTSTTTQAETTTTTTSTTTEEELITPNYAVDGCPDGLYQVEGLPDCCIDEPNYLGDGACDPWGPYNTADCAYDLGDCCYETCNHDSPYGCMMKDGNDDEVGPFGFFCLDPRYSVIDESKCDVENREWIGDGGCDADGGYNTEECKFVVLFSCVCFTEPTCSNFFATYSNNQVDGTWATVAKRHVTRSTRSIPVVLISPIHAKLQDNIKTLKKCFSRQDRQYDMLANS